MALFVGEFDQTLDAKRRLAIPAALREQIDSEADGEGFFLVLGPDMHLWMYPDRYYRTLTASIKRSPFPTPEAARMSLFYAMARYVKPDGQGRVVLPEKSLARARVDAQLTLVGHDDHIELWPTEQWDAHVAEQLPHYGQTLMDFGQRMAQEP